MFCLEGQDDAFDPLPPTELTNPSSTAPAPAATATSTHASATTTFSSYRLLQLARLHVMPDIIYVSSKAPPALVAALKAPLFSSETQIAPNHNQSFTQNTGREEENEDFQHPSSTSRVLIERAKLFSLDSARATLEAVHLPTLPPSSFKGPRERLHVLNTTISLCRELQICAAGALLAILSHEGVLVRNPSAPTASLPLAALKEASLQGHLLVDPASLEALHIFHEEKHPSAMGLGKSKEGLSVFGMLNRCVSPPGKRMLRLWFARPLVDIPALEERMDGIDALMKGEYASALRAALRAVKDPARQLQKLENMQTLPDPADFVALQNSFDALLRVRDIAAMLSEMFSSGNNTSTDQQDLRSFEEEQEEQEAAAPSSTTSSSTTSLLFSRLAAAISDDLISARQLISSVIDPTQAPEGMAVHYGISEQLDEMKSLFYGLPDLLRQVEQHEISRLPRSVQHTAQSTWSVAYIPQVGFLLQVEGALLGADVLEQLPDIELAMGHGVSFEDGRQGGCYHTDTTRELTERYGDVLPKIRDLETMICNNVAQELGSRSGVVRAAADAAAELDCLLSLADAAVEMKLVRPRITEENVLEIKKGRHLLAEAVLSSYSPSYTTTKNNNNGNGDNDSNDGDYRNNSYASSPSSSFIPNDTSMFATSQRIHVITGPNLSGKSLYAKQVAIIVFLSHVGSFVPAESALIGLTDRIFTRVVTKESGTVPQSSFMIDLSQVASMLRLATPRSLLIIDEFGKGTLATDGVGLLCGSLAYLATPRGSSNSGSLTSQAQEPPRVLLATHFTEVLNPKYLPRSEYLAFYTMAVALGNDGDEGEEREPESMVTASTNINDLVFLYRLTPGHVGPSFGVHVAHLAGVEKNVVQRAEKIIECIRAGKAITREEYTTVVEKTALFRDIVSQLLRVDCTDAGEVKKLLKAAALAAAAQ
jgi:DNA mismatch repair protein MSH5